MLLNYSCAMAGSLIRQLRMKCAVARNARTDKCRSPWFCFTCALNIKSVRSHSRPQPIPTKTVSLGK